jgi:hypothetical protein
VLDDQVEARKACRVYVGLLHLAAMHGCEAMLADHLAAVLDAGGTPDLEAARAATGTSERGAWRWTDWAGRDRRLTSVMAVLVREATGSDSCIVRNP